MPLDVSGVLIVLMMSGKKLSELRFVFILYSQDTFAITYGYVLCLSIGQANFARFQFQNGNKPKKMTSSWEPDPSCYDVLKLAKINKKFAVEQLAEFRIFWIDSNEIMTSWNSKFIQHVKYKWYKNNPEASGIISRLNDKEWAVDVEH